jgi:hypothetical protein
MKVTVELDLDIERDAKIHFIIMRWNNIMHDVKQAYEFLDTDPAEPGLGWGNGPKGKLRLAYAQMRSFASIVRDCFGEGETDK